MPDAKKLTLAHVTHEAVEQLGGIGTVLEGLFTSTVYQSRVKRSILIGPTSAQLGTDPASRLGEHGKVLYSSIDGIDEAGLGGKLRPIEWAFNVALVYGTRTYDPPGQGRSGEAEVLLVDVFRVNSDRLNIFKLRLWETFGLDSAKYEAAWDYEEYTRLAEPALYALRALLGKDDKPCVLFSHEFMGMPTVLGAIAEGGDDFRTVFHAHECATARRIVEHHDGHDTMFYNVLDQAMAGQKPRYVNDTFGDQSPYLRHALISRAHLCDGVIAVGDRTADELRFLGPDFARHPIELVYNGLPAFPVTLKSKTKSRAMLLDWCEAVVGHRPDVLMTHVTRPVISKGLWRDVKLCGELDKRFAKDGRKGVLIILTSAGGTRRTQDIHRMEKQYGWPRHHREGYPDLVGPEVDLHRMIEPFNAGHEHVQIVLVNQFGWSLQRTGKAVPEKMHIGDFRVATDVEFGMATYEPFGISPLEPLAAGAVCVISNVCGCEGFVRSVTNGKEVPNVLTADYTRLPYPMEIDHLKSMTRDQRDEIERRVAGRVAADLLDRLPADDAARKALIESGQKLVKRMGWDQVIESHLLPLLERVVADPVPA